jgi:hypothetical protein
MQECPGAASMGGFMHDGLACNTGADAYPETIPEEDTQTPQTCT